MKHSLILLGLASLLLISILWVSPLAADEGDELHFVMAYYSGPGLSGAHGVAVSPDDRYVYIAGSKDDALAVFRRDPGSGKLTFIEKHLDEVNGVDGLSGAWAIAVSPDGRHLYVTAYGDKAITVFARNTDGTLTFIQTIKDGMLISGGRADNLEEPAAVTISPDGNHVYVGSYAENAVTVFSRDEKNGHLSFIEVVKIRDDYNAGSSWGDIDITISPDGQNVYVISSREGAILTFSRAAGSGKLSFRQVIQEGDMVLHRTVSSLKSVVAVTVSPDGQHVYTVGGGAITLFRRSEADGALSYEEVFKEGVNLSGAVIKGLVGVKAISLSPNGQQVYVISNPVQAAAVAVFARDAASGTLVQTQVIDHDTPIPDAPDLGYDVQGLTVSYDGRHIYVTGGDAVIALARDQSNGHLSFVERKGNNNTALPSSLGPAHLAISPDDRYIYIASPWDDGVFVFEWDKSKPQLTLVETIQADQDGGRIDGLRKAAGVVVSPDGQNVYVLGEGDNAIAVFSRNQANGKLTLIEVIKDDFDYRQNKYGMMSPHRLELSPDGRHLFVVSNGEAPVITLFSRDPLDGRLTFAGAVNAVTNPNGATAQLKHWDSEVEMDANTVTISDETAVGLEDAHLLAVSPDSRYFYVSGFADGSAAAFTWDPTTGEPTLAQWIKDSAAEKRAISLNRTEAAIISPDGRHLYGLGQYDHEAIAVFARDLQTGILTFTQVITLNALHPIADRPYFDPRSLTISPTGQRVYAVGGADDSVAIFSRDQDLGTLTFIERLKSSPLYPLIPFDVVVDHHGEHIYVKASRDSLFVFAVGPAPLAALPTPTTTPTAVPPSTLPPAPTPILQPEPTRVITPTPTPQPVDVTPVPCNKLTIFKDKQEVYYHQQSTYPVQDIYLVNPDGSGATRFLHHRGEAWLSAIPGWSPDGTKLAYFFSLPGDNTALYLISADGRHPQDLGGVPGKMYSWLPDSPYLLIFYTPTSHMNPERSISAFNTKTGVHYSTTYIVPGGVPYLRIPDYSKDDWLGDVPLNIEAIEWAYTDAGKSGAVRMRNFSLDKEWLVYTLFEYEQDKTTPYLARSDGSVVKPYPQYKSVPAETVCMLGDGWGNLHSALAWTPDSRHMIFATYQDKQVQLWTLGVEDEKETPIVTFPAPGCPSNWRWSADKQHASFFIATGGQSDHEVGDIYLLDWPAGQPYLAVPGVNEELNLPKWSTQPDYVLLSADPRLVVWDARKGQAIVQIDQTLRGYFCDWMLDGTRLSCPGFFLDARTGKPNFVAMSGSAQWSPNGRWLADRNEDGNLRVFDVETGQITPIMRNVGSFTWTPGVCDPKAQP